MQVNIHGKIPNPARQQAAAAPARVSIPGIAKMQPKDAFIASYKLIREALLKDLDNNVEIDAHRRRYLGQCMDANCLGGKYNRGICVVEVAAAATNNNNQCDQAKDETVFAACVLGWAIEFLQAHFLVEDDIMDGSSTRRGNPCWYKRKGVSTAVAINDGLIVLAWCTRMIEEFLSWHPNRFVFFQILHKTDFLTTIGQLYDTTSVYDSAKLNPDEECPATTDFKEFTLHTYNRIVKYKTAFYTYHAPMVLGLSVVGQLDSVTPALVEKLAVTMGEYFQVQDDFLDCFGDPAHIGKIGTDIEDNKCSWLACTFLATMKDDAEAIATFKANYGQHDAAKVKIIKDLYRKAKLEDAFAKYEQGIVVSVNEMLAQIKEQNLGFFEGVTQLWGRTYKRTK
jgi:farnesyl diphosphate synthase